MRIWEWFNRAFEKPRAGKSRHFQVISCEHTWNRVRVSTVAFSEGPKLRYLLEDENNKGFYRRRAGAVVTRAELFL